MKSIDVTISWRGSESLSVAIKLAENRISKFTIEKETS